MGGIGQFPVSDDRYWQEWINAFRTALTAYGLNPEIANTIVNRARKRCSAIPTSMNYSAACPEGCIEHVVKFKTEAEKYTQTVYKNLVFQILMVEAELYMVLPYDEPPKTPSWLRGVIEGGKGDEPAPE